MDWTEVYRPQSLSEIVGNGAAIGKLRQWADSWAKGTPKNRAIILAGIPGVGKTTAALALARDMDWAVIELNASDARNAEKIRKVATAGAVHQTFGADGAFHSTTGDGGRKLIILDEADNLYERAGKDGGGTGSEMSDRGGKTQILETIRQTKQPIILIVNDLYALQKGSGSAFANLAEVIKFTKVNVRSIPKALAAIAQKEGVAVDLPVFDAIAQKAGGDMRAAVRDLESLCVGRSRVTLHDLGDMGYRDTTGNMFDAVRHILKGRDIAQLRREIRDVDATPADIVLWVDENLPKEYVHPEDLVAGYDMLSRADRFLGRTQRTQNYRLWAYASDLATAGVMAQKQHSGPSKFVPFGFPQWLSKMSRSRGARQTKDALAQALAGHVHSSRRKSRNEQVPMVEVLFRSDPEFAAHMTHRLQLEDSAVAVLMDDKVTSKRVKEVRAAADALAASRAPEPAAKPAGGLGSFEEAPPAPKKPERRPERPSGGQKTLF